MHSSDELTKQVQRVYRATENSWNGCDWPTNFGTRGLNLGGLKSKQTRLLKEATSGAESQAWDEATIWLEQVEADARRARSAASVAVELIEQQDLAMALVRITEACELESQYHQNLAWGPLRDLISYRSHDGRTVACIGACCQLLETT